MGRGTDRILEAHPMEPRVWCTDCEAIVATIDGHFDNEECENCNGTALDYSNERHMFIQGTHHKECVLCEYPRAYMKHLCEETDCKARPHRLVVQSHDFS